MRVPVIGDEVPGAVEEETAQVRCADLDYRLVVSRGRKPWHRPRFK